MKHSKNRKKQWKKVLPGLDDDIYNSNQIKEIEDASFSITGKVKATKLKYSTVPRIITQRKNKFVKTEIIDVWANDNGEKPKLSKRRQKMMDNITRYNKPNEIIHPGTSWFPPKKEHDELLDMLEKDQILRNNNAEKFVIKESEFIDNGPTNTGEKSDEEEVMETTEKAVVKKPKHVTTKMRKQKLTKLKQEIFRQKRNLKAKSEAHELRNIPKFVKEIKTTVKEQKEKLQKAKEFNIQKKADKIVKEQIHRMPFQLASELAPNLRSMASEGDLLRELGDKFNAHKFRSDTHKKMRKMKKMVKKKGLV